MIQLAQSLQAWPGPGFERVFKAELLAVAGHRLPLQQGLRHGSHALEEGVELSLLGASEGEEALRIQLGVHYRSLIAGCSCADDPTPQDTLAEYCTLQVEIDKQTAVASIRLLEID